MTSKRWIAVFLVSQLLTTLGILNTASAQTRVALVDIGEVFKSHPVFTQQLEALKQEAEQFKASSLQLQQSLMQKAEVLKNYTPDSENFKKTEASLAQESAAMEVDQRNKMRKLMQQEARLHFDTYAEVNELIGKYCDDHGIQLVLKYNSAQMDMKNPSSIMQRVNGSIVYHDQSKDITSKIIAQIVQMKGSASIDNGARNR